MLDLKEVTVAGDEYHVLTDRGRSDPYVVLW
jgi:hypothetical protein